jgi:hypothetical protein
MHEDSLFGTLLDTEKEPGQVIEDGRGETEGVDTIQNARVPHDQRPVIVHAPVSLDSAHGHSSCETEDRDNDGHES